MHGEQQALAQLRARVMSDAALQQRLSRIEDRARFIELAADSAAVLGIGPVSNAVADMLRADPLALAGWTTATADGSVWPPAQWLPIQVAPVGGELGVEWAYFGDAPLTEPFFEGEIRITQKRPFCRAFRYRMTLTDFLNAAGSEPHLPPNGFIFHMSRCGSTLATQMLATLPQTIVISEAAPIDAMVQVGRAAEQTAAAAQALRAMVAAYGRRRGGQERQYVIKLDSWHSLALPLFRRAFPDVPWVFLYRDPAEVLVSQMRQRGAQMIPQFMPPSLYGIDAGDGLPTEDYCARVLAAVCQAAIDNHGAGGGLLLNYRQLPQAVWTTIMPHFGMACGAHERDTMRRAAATGCQDTLAALCRRRRR